jgi:hypothetical protein
VLNTSGEKLHLNWVPISLIALLAPVLSMGIRAHTLTQKNSEDIAYLHTLVHGRDVDILDRIQSIDDKINNSNISIAEIKTDISYLRRLLDAERTKTRESD